MSETLLPLQREFTDKEKYEWMKQEYTVLEKRHRGLIDQNKNLVSKNKVLSQIIKEHEEEIPSVLHSNNKGA